jgi:hypothetical protein
LSLPIELMILSEFVATGQPEMSVFQGLSGGKICRADMIASASGVQDKMGCLMAGGLFESVGESFAETLGWASSEKATASSSKVESPAAMCLGMGWLSSVFGGTVFWERTIIDGRGNETPEKQLRLSLVCHLATRATIRAGLDQINYSRAVSLRPFFLP